MTAHATFPQRDGAIVESFAPSIRNRAIAATKLCDAIADCNRDDAVVILEAALRDLSAGGPLPVFLSAMSDARWWASIAAPHELKAWALASYDAMRPQHQRMFLAHVTKGGAA